MPLRSSAPRSLSRCVAQLGRFEARQTRGISTSYLEKLNAAEERWEEKAERIRKGEERHVLDVLEERGYIKDITGTRENMKEIMRIKRIGAYVGVDPTADSLHIGHLLPFMPLFWLWFHGHPAVTLLGGSTGRIGDPSHRSTSREPLTNAQLSKNITKLHYQLTRIWSNVCSLREKYNYEKDWAARRALLNNSMWLQGLSIYDFSKRLAKHTRVGSMLARDSVKKRMEDGDGMSMAEFMYPLYQGWDFWHLYNKLNIQLQIGGSDQFGNIVAGIEAVKIIRASEEMPTARMPTGWQHEPLGFTVPLQLDSSGEKIGKSAGNGIWLDDFKTSAFDLYGYFVRRSDEDVERLLKLYTFMPMDKIQETMTQHQADPSKRVAQHTLAFEVLSLVHGTQRALQEAKQHEFRFGSELPKIYHEPAPHTGIITANTAPRSDIQLPQSIMKLSPAKILFAAGLVGSSSEGQRIVAAEGAYIAAQPGQNRGLVPGNLNWTPIKMWFPEETSRYLIDGTMLILRKGKHNIRIVELISDAEWKESGKTYPGEPYTGVVRLMQDKLFKEAENDDGETLSKTAIKKQVREQSKINARQTLIEEAKEAGEPLSKAALRKRMAEKPWLNSGRNDQRNNEDRWDRDDKNDDDSTFKNVRSREDKNSSWETEVRPRRNSERPQHRWLGRGHISSRR
ncbi:hypothetical protein E4U17_006756 [Claviceps sp. LM77 group G4]|nr:hypothetical protein E4U17_006756 [Claviceps sp. LM77 group G4]KAG6057004.1 hypothetical protein E4U33_007563 [Claviceps sp. LM78 group G4]KAG6081530.1 hypothetical protein E4U16_007289 [Claviceps sp. LM84 group G4]